MISSEMLHANWSEESRKKGKVNVSSSSTPPSLHLFHLDDPLPALFLRREPIVLENEYIDQDSLQVFQLWPKRKTKRKTFSTSALLPPRLGEVSPSPSLCLIVELTPSEGLQLVHCKISSEEHCCVPKLVLRESSEGKERTRD